MLTIPHSPPGRLSWRAQRERITELEDTVTRLAGELAAARARETAGLLDLSDERDTWERLTATAERRSYDAGRADGITEGRARVIRAWQAGLEHARYGPRGRAGFAQPRPGDYPGQQ